MTPAEATAVRIAYEQATTERARAEAAAKAYLAVRRGQAAAQNGSELRRLTAQVLGVSQYLIGAYRSLLAAGEMADPLWLALDGTLTWQAAQDLLHEARETRRQGESGKQACQRVLTAYEQQPVLRHLPGGRVLRGKGEAVSDPPEAKPKAPGPTVARTKPAEAAPEPPPESERGGQPVTAMAHWAKIRQCVEAYLLSQVAGEFDAEAIGAQMAWLDGELRLVLQQFSHRLRKSTTEPSLREVLQRRHVREACRVLLVDPPRKLDAVPPAFFAEAKKRFKALAKEYHPDTSSGGEATRPQFEAVRAAWDVIEQLSATQPGR